MPTEGTDEVRSGNLFDEVAARGAATVARAPFFTFCIALIALWAPTILFLSLDTWQLIINTITTIITFLLVALLQNTQDRATQALAHKLDAISEGLAVLLGDHPDGADCVAELRRMAGVEMEESKKR